MSNHFGTVGCGVWSLYVIFSVHTYLLFKLDTFTSVRYSLAYMFIIMLYHGRHCYSPCSVRVG